jgi:hypothetical protein
MQGDSVEIHKPKLRLLQNMKGLNLHLDKTDAALADTEHLYK